MSDEFAYNMKYFCVTATAVFLSIIINQLFRNNLLIVCFGNCVQIAKQDDESCGWLIIKQLKSKETNKLEKWQK
jgi:hypothetical protein